MGLFENHQFRVLEHEYQLERLQTLICEVESWLFGNHDEHFAPYNVIPIYLISKN